MSDAESQVVDAPVEAPDEPTGTTDAGETADDHFDAERAKAKIAKANREAESLRKRIKDLEPLAQEAQQLREAQMSETERLTTQLAEARAAAEAAQAEALRLKVATIKGLDPILAERLRGATEDEMAEDADRLLAVMPKKPATPGSADGGPQGASGPTQWTQADLAGKTPEQIVAADAAGLLEDLKTGRAS